jgi:hypothetical protein
MRAPAGLVRGEEVHGVQHRVGRRLAKLQHQAHYHLPPQATAASTGTETCALTAGVQGSIAGAMPSRQQQQQEEEEATHQQTLLSRELNYLSSLRRNKVQ